MNNNDALIKAIEWCDVKLVDYSKYPNSQVCRVIEKMKDMLLSLQSQQVVVDEQSKEDILEKHWQHDTYPVWGGDKAVEYLHEDKCRRCQHEDQVYAAMEEYKNQSQQGVSENELIEAMDKAFVAGRSKISWSQFINEFFEIDKAGQSTFDEQVVSAPLIPIDEVLSILNENYQAAKRGKENAYTAKEYRQKDALDLLIKTYEDLIAIFNNRRNRYNHG